MTNPATSIVPNLWFDTEAEEAADFYTSVFPRSEITNIIRNTPSSPGETGTVVTVDFTLDGQRFTAINGGPGRAFTEAVSFAVPCADQADADHLWDALVEGGEEVQCGWLRDRYGLSWQVFPAEIDQLLGDPDRERADRAMAAMMKMVRIDVAAMRAAADETA